MWNNEAEAREEIKALVAEYYKQFKAEKKTFLPGDRINYGGRAFDEREMLALTDAALDFWLTTGRFSQQFEKMFCEYLGVKFAHIVNSGSSANLLAFMALTAPELGERRIRPGDEVITVACAFPTTVSPIIQYGAIPVFVDVTIPQYNIDVSRLEEAYSNKTKAVMIAHTLGNPFDIKSVKDFCDRHDLWLIEDNCDSLGSEYTIRTDDLSGNIHRNEDKTDSSVHKNEDETDSSVRGNGDKTDSSVHRNGDKTDSSVHRNEEETDVSVHVNETEETRLTGAWGDIGTSSFYPPHHMTMGEGGCVYTNNPLLSKLILSYRDWGRDCVCASGQDNRCGHRYDGQFGELPQGYDHKYVYSHLGYNLKATDMQAAIGVEQLKKINGFTEARRRNWQRLYDRLSGSSAIGSVSGRKNDLADGLVPEKLILPEPAENSNPSWFGFLISVRPDSGVTRDQITKHLEDHNIQTRLLFSGNLIRHPAFDDIRGTDKYRVVGKLENTDFIMNNSFWIGVYPGMTDEMLDYMAECIIEALK